MVLIVMGVTGCGKTTVGARLAEELDWGFEDADEFHPPENIAKMSRGVALTDADRAPWLAAIRARAEKALAKGEPLVMGCSALKAAYRRVLAEGLAGVRFIYLRGDEALLAERLRNRLGHFMDPGLLGSQLATLEEPDSAVRIEIALPLAAQVRAIRERLGAEADGGTGTGEKG